MIAGDENAILYITDSESYKYLDGLTENGLFDGEPIKLGDEFYSATESEQLGKLPEGLQISCRRISDTVLEGKKGAAEAYENALKLIEKLKKAS